MTFFNRIKKAFDVLNGKDVEIVEVKKDSELYALVSDKITSIDSTQLEKLEKRLTNVEKVMNFLLVKLNDVVENQKASNDLLLNTATMVEEIYNVFGSNDLVGIKTSDTGADKQSSDKDFNSITKIPKKSEMN
jgi:hypothetical protein